MLALGLAGVLAGCGYNTGAKRMGMVVNEETGYQYGSRIYGDASMVVDPGPDTGIKIRVRNTSGDTAFDLHQFRSQLEADYEAKGFRIERGGNYTIMLDINVVFSGQYSTNDQSRYASWGGIGGGAVGTGVGYNRNGGVGAAVGGVAGAAAGVTLGYLVGTFTEENVFISRAVVRVLTKSQAREDDGETIYFGKKIKRRRDDDIAKFRKRSTLYVSAYGGGRTGKQSVIAPEVRRRFIRIFKDII
ncbi:hypothetical protein MAIT1_00645 [Magnetofaba australis IT-1]|uniref:TraT complement resistance protein n=1 Tax=Magnetofaba australis IT-1 TaxID=1434232 RepID=A0A1Y2K1L3_9PROT|nr:hypothetical protein MAIT1_00645 [Magnetofaba australis IT-1]